MLLHSFIRLLIVLPILPLTGSLFSASSCPNLELPHGRIKIRSRGRIAKFSCYKPYILIGDNVATCVQGNWNVLPPFCAATRCHKLGKLMHGELVSNYRGAVLKPICDPGFTLIGSPLLYCRGWTWNDSLPVCQAESFDQFKKCHFEPDDPDQCNWINEAGEFAWSIYPPKLSSFSRYRRNYTSSPNDFPSFDHTLAPKAGGHYLYLDTFYTNRRTLKRYMNEHPRVAEYVSPLFPVTDNATVEPCVIFWYYMYGPLGTIRVNIENDTLWQESGNQGNRWQKTIIKIGQRSKPFRITIQGSGTAGLYSNTAIDDLQVATGPECDKSTAEIVGYSVEPEIPPRQLKTANKDNVRYNLTNTVVATMGDEDDGGTTSSSDSSGDNFSTTSISLEIHSGNRSVVPPPATVANGKDKTTTNPANVEKSASETAPSTIDYYSTSSAYGPTTEYFNYPNGSSFKPISSSTTVVGWLEVLSTSGDSLSQANTNAELTTNTELTTSTYTITLNDNCCSTINATASSDLTSTGQEVTESMEQHLPTSVTDADEENSVVAATFENIAAGENRTDNNNVEYRRMFSEKNRTLGNRNSTVENRTLQTANIDGNILSSNDLSVLDPIKNDEDDFQTVRLTNRKYFPSEDGNNTDDKEGAETNDWSAEESTAIIDLTNSSSVFHNKRTEELNGTKELLTPAIRRILNGKQKSHAINSSSEEMYKVFESLDSDNLTIIADESTTAMLPIPSTVNASALADTEHSHESKSEMSTRPSVRSEKKLPNATWNNYAEKHRNNYYNLARPWSTSLKNNKNYNYNSRNIDNHRNNLSIHDHPSLRMNNKFLKIHENSLATNDTLLLLRKKNTDDITEKPTSIDDRSVVIGDGGVNKTIINNRPVVPTGPSSVELIALTDNEQFSRTASRSTALPFDRTTNNNGKSIVQKLSKYKKKLLKSRYKQNNDGTEQQFVRENKLDHRPLQKEINNGKSIKHAEENASYLADNREDGNYYQTFTNAVDITTSIWRRDLLSSVVYSTNFATDPPKVPPKVPPLTVKREMVPYESKKYFNSITSTKIGLLSMITTTPIFLLIMILARNWYKRYKKSKTEGLLENTDTVEMNSWKPGL